MRKGSIAFLALILGLLAFTPALGYQASAATATAQIQASVSFRTGPSTSSQVMKYLKAGEEVVILEKVNSYWYKVQNNQGTIGYVSSQSKYIRINGGGSSGSATVTAQIQASVSFRTGPSTSSQVMKYLKAGEEVVILEKVNSYWYKVQNNQGTIGYVSSQSKYIKLNNGSSDSSSGNAVIVASVSFRTGPSTDSPRMRYLSGGETVTVIGQPNSYWYQVRDSGGTVGYVSTDPKYISVSGSPAESPDSGGLTGSEAVEKVIAAGMKYLGTPYEYGSNRNTTTTFDCSDFVRTAFRDALGITLPSDSRQQGAYVKQRGVVVTDWHNLKRGDLMFFMDYKGTSKSAYAGINKSTARITHVAIYLGDGKVLQTYSKESGGVRVDSIAGRHWEYRFLFGGSAI